MELTSVQVYQTYRPASRRTWAGVTEANRDQRVEGELKAAGSGLAAQAPVAKQTARDDPSPLFMRRAANAFKCRLWPHPAAEVLRGLGPRRGKVAARVEVVPLHRQLIDRGVHPAAEGGPAVGGRGRG
jgi:hypothetical protein